MTNEQRADAPRFEVRATADSHFGWLRTRLSLERTLMSWVRTGAALIGFGFTIFQFLEHFSATAGVAPAVRPMAPWMIGLAMVGTGVVALFIAVGEYRRASRYLWSEPFRPIAGMDATPVRTPALAVTVLLAVVGLFAFAMILMRIA